MGNELNVDPQTIKRGGAGIRSAAHQVQSEWETLQGKLSGYGEPWGGDMIGMLIGGCYAAIFEVAAECVTGNVTGMTDHAEGATLMASNYFQSEEASMVEVNRVRQILG
ncbi:hypothetical protein [Actinomadura rugatobispora]|uniref:WXG100 family type VII secretion target n=1 Tax=Actinomadura rugatobispora TaxID=1994 RepID=A0ABW0ZUD6_9ACTN|nr:hypothetical protein GCM10010200_050450 [Actinomadura rugatobispora]